MQARGTSEFIPWAAYSGHCSALALELLGQGERSSLPPSFGGGSAQAPDAVQKAPVPRRWSLLLLDGGASTGVRVPSTRPGSASGVDVGHEQKLGDQSAIEGRLGPRGGSNRTFDQSVPCSPTWQRADAPARCHPFE